MDSDLSIEGMQLSMETQHAIMGAHKVLVRSIARNLTSEGLTPAQFEVLRVIVKRGPMPMGRLSKEMLVSPPNITGIIDRLERRGLVKRVAHVRDRRASMIEITEEGRGLYKALARRQRASLQSVLEVLTTDEQKILATLLTRLRDGIVRREEFG